MFTYMCPLSVTSLRRPRSMLIIIPDDPSCVPGDDPGRRTQCHVGLPSWDLPRNTPVHQEVEETDITVRVFYILLDFLLLTSKQCFLVLSIRREISSRCYIYDGLRIIQKSWSNKQFRLVLTTTGYLAITFITIVIPIPMGSPW